jgi:FlaG/FlaF family flagellin (archaellin)
MWLRKRAGKLTGNSRGFSSVIGTIFMVLMVMTLATSVFLWTLYQSTLYNNAVKAQNQQELDVRNENVAATNGNYSVSGNQVTVVAKLTNAGPVAVQIVNLWVFDTSKQTYGFNNSLASMSGANLNPGQVLNLTGVKAMKVTVPNAASLDNFNIWFVTARGNTVPLTQSQSIIIAQIAQGIGSVAMDFTQFTHYDFTSSPVNGTNIGTGKKSYSFYGGNYTILACLFTNLDPSRQNINLTAKSFLWMTVPQSGTLKQDAWPIIKVVNNKYISTFGFQVLPYGVSTWVYFGPWKPKFCTGVVPVFILLSGKLGTRDYGQNIPFVAVDIT